MPPALDRGRRQGWPWLASRASAGADEVRCSVDARMRYAWALCDPCEAAPSSGCRSDCSASFAARGAPRPGGATGGGFVCTGRSGMQRHGFAAVPWAPVGDRAPGSDGEPFVSQGRGLAGGPWRASSPGRFTWMRLALLFSMSGHPQHQLQCLTPGRIAGPGLRQRRGDDLRHPGDRFALVPRLGAKGCRHRAVPDRARRFGARAAYSEGT